MWLVVRTQSDVNSKWKIELQLELFPLQLTRCCMLGARCYEWAHVCSDTVPPDSCGRDFILNVEFVDQAASGLIKPTCHCKLDHNGNVFPWSILMLAFADDPMLKP